MTMTYLLYSDRLHLRPCQNEDLDSLHELWTEVDIRRFLFDDRIISREEAQSFIDLSIKSFKNGGYGLWLFFEGQSDLIAGFAGLLDFSQEAPSLIFGTNPLLWGRDYAAEAASVVLRYAFDTLKRDRVLADVDEPNAASIRVLEKLGMSPTRRAIVNERPLLYYEIRDRVGN
jgi:RimJ/RimL family protein N-acetyltransferase